VWKEVRIQKREDSSSGLYLNSGKQRKGRRVVEVGGMSVMAGSDVRRVGQNLNDLDLGLKSPFVQGGGGVGKGELWDHKWATGAGMHESRWAREKIAFGEKRLRGERTREGRTRNDPKKNKRRGRERLERGHGDDIPRNRKTFVTGLWGERKSWTSP